MTFLVIRTSQELIKLPLLAIYYVKTNRDKPHHVTVVTKEDTYDMVGDLTSLEKEYSEHFIRCHRQCLVNLANITAIHLTSREIILGNPEKYRIFFSRRRYQQLRAVWLQKGAEK